MSEGFEEPPLYYWPVSFFISQFFTDIDMKKLTTVLAILTVSSAKIVNAQSTETIKLRLDQDRLIVQAQTTGCTQKEHFDFSINKKTC